MNTQETQIKYIEQRYGADLARQVDEECRQVQPSAHVEPLAILRRLQRMEDAKRYHTIDSDDDMRSNTD